MSPKLRIFLLIAVVVVILDQLTKYWVVSSIGLHEAVPVIDGFFSITHVLNRGIVFGLFQGGYVAIFLLLTVVAVGLIGTFYRQLPSTDLLSTGALGLILGGAIGNGIDRLARQAVVDFLHFELGMFTYPDFNVADSCIVIGVGLLLFAPQSWTSPASSDAQPPARAQATASGDPG